MENKIRAVCRGRPAPENEPDASRLAGALAKDQGKAGCGREAAA